MTKSVTQNEFLLRVLFLLFKKKMRGAALSTNYTLFLIVILLCLNLFVSFFQKHEKHPGGVIPSIRKQRASHQSSSSSTSVVETRGAWLSATNYAAGGIFRALPPPILDRYIISSAVYYGRISNAKISVAEVIGLALALNRTAVIPKLEECHNIFDGIDDAHVDQLFDLSLFSRASVVSKAGFDAARLCGDDVVSIAVSGFHGFDEVKSDLGSDKKLQLSQISLPKPLLFGESSSLEDVLKSYPYNGHFNPETRNIASRYMTDLLLPDKLAALGNHRCIVIGRNFYSLNWARLPNEFSEVHKELQPNPTIRSDVLEFLLQNELIDSIHDPSRPTVLPFVAIHLRMGDFVSKEAHHSFGVQCNQKPEILSLQVKEALANVKRKQDNDGLRVPIVLATDDYSSACANHLRKSFTNLIQLESASRFHSRSCRAALFDQEILGASEFFFGDQKSTFSQAIHQIRTLRHNKGVETTKWL